MHDKFNSFILNVFGEFHNFYLTIVIAITGGASRLDVVEQWMRIVASGLLIASTALVILLNLSKAYEKAKEIFKRSRDKC